MNDIAEILAETLMDSDTDRLAAAMLAYRAKYGRSLQGLMRIPGFRQLWWAMEEACAYHGDKTTAEEAR